MIVEKVSLPIWYPKSSLNLNDGAWILDQSIVNKYDKENEYTYNIKNGKLYSVYKYQRSNL